MRTTPAFVIAALAWLSSLAAQAQGAPPSQPQAPADSPAPAATEPTPAPAQPTAPAEPTEEQLAAARTAYANGQKLFAEGRFADARAAFREAYASVPNPIVLRSIAECELRLGNYEDALAALTEYLQRQPDAEDRAQVEARIAEIEATPAALVLTTNPAGASVRIDGADTGLVTPAELSLPRGEHRIELALEGYTPLAETFSAKAGVRHELHADLRELPPPPPPPPAPEPAPPPPPAPEPPTTAIWVTGIVGATGLVAGTVLGFMALAERSDFDANPTAASADRGERLALFADVSFGVGAMGALTALVLYMSAGDAAEAEAPAASARVQLAPVIGPDQVGLVGGGRF